MEGKERFHIQEDDFAQKRFEALQESMCELKAEHPEVAGMTLYGSLSKGLSRPESDIDAHLFVDTEVLSNVLGNDNAKWGELLDITEAGTTDFYNIPIRRYEPKFGGDIYAYCKNLLTDKIKERLPELSEKQMHNISPRPISMEGIDIAVAQIVENMHYLHIYDNEARQTITDAKDKAEYLARAQKLASRPKEVIAPPILFHHMFHLDIGEGMRPYRERLLKRLWEAGEDGKHIWSKVVGDLESWEQKLTNDGDLGQVYYPRSLEDAVVVYGSNEFKEQLNFNIDD